MSFFKKTKTNLSNLKIFYNIRINKLLFFSLNSMIMKSGLTEIILIGFLLSIVGCTSSHNLKKAQQLHSKKDYSQALIYYNKAINSDPKNIDAYIDRAKCKNAMKNFNGAISDYNKAISLEPLKSDLFWLRAGCKNDNGDLNGAVIDLTKAIELAPLLAEPAYLDRGRIYMKLKEYKKAIKDFTKLIEQNSYLAYLAYQVRGISRFYLNDNTGALDDFNIVIGKFPKYGEAFFYRGCVFFNQKLVKSACQDWNYANSFGYIQAMGKLNQYCK